MKAYKIEYWYLSFYGQLELGYDFNTIEVKAVSPKQAILKAKQNAHRGAKDFKII